MMHGCECNQSTTRIVEMLAGNSACTINSAFKAPCSRPTTRHNACRWQTTCQHRPIKLTRYGYACRSRLGFGTTIRRIRGLEKQSHSTMKSSDS